MLRSLLSRLSRQRRDKMSDGRFFRGAIFLILALVTFSGCSSIRNPPAPREDLPRIVFLPQAVSPFWGGGSSHFLTGLSKLFDAHDWDRLDALLDKRLSEKDIPGDVMARLLYDKALVDIETPGGKRLEEARKILKTLDVDRVPYDVRESSHILLRMLERNSRLEESNRILTHKLDQVRKTFKDLSNLENTLK